ncbi:hypothetical protein [Deinococcus navajonensis]|uniref:Uncharacterized protein n=1 Tax=Deinococcus navajonensis TaxID=309884 RepID=A0ABV8XJJ5_9DEIO
MGRLTRNRGVTAALTVLAVGAGLAVFSLRRAESGRTSMPIQVEYTVGSRLKQESFNASMVLPEGFETNSFLSKLERPGGLGLRLRVQERLDIPSAEGFTLVKKKVTPKEVRYVFQAAPGAAGDQYHLAMYRLTRSTPELWMTCRGFAEDVAELEAYQQACSSIALRL